MARGSPRIGLAGSGGEDSCKLTDAEVSFIHSLEGLMIFLNASVCLVSRMSSGGFGASRENPGSLRRKPCITHAVYCTVSRSSPSLKAKHHHGMEAPSVRVERNTRCQSN